MAINKTDSDYAFCGRYECHDNYENAHKFYEVHVNLDAVSEWEDDAFEVSYGGIGKKPKYFYYSYNEIEKKIREKLNKGYEKVRTRNRAPEVEKPKVKNVNDSRLDNID